MLTAGCDFNELYDAALWAAPWMLSLVVVSIFGLYQRFKPFQVSSEVPGPPRKPFLGILKFFEDNFDRLPCAVSELSSKFNRTWGGPIPVIGSMTGAVFFVVDEAGVQHILKDQFHNYSKAASNVRMYEEIFGHGIFASDGKQWKIHRKIGVSLFTRNFLRQSANVIQSKLHQTAQLFYTRLDQQQASGGSFIDVDLQSIFSRITIDYFLQIAFDVDINSVSMLDPHPFVLAFDELKVLVTRRFSDPLFEFKKWSGMFPGERRIKALVAVIDNFLYDIISSKCLLAANGGGLGVDLISLFLKSSNNESTVPSKKDLRDFVMNFLVAGRDTTALSLTWAFYELSRNPKVVERVIVEVNNICGEESNADYSFENLNKLEYTHAVVMEVLRLHPVLPNATTYAINDDTLPDGTFIPSRSCVFYAPYAMGRSKKLWGDDSEEFKPERFFKQPKPSAYKFIAFNAGPRSCIGEPLAVMTMKMSLAFLLQKFTFQDVAGHSGEYGLYFLLEMKNGFPVRVSKKI